MKKPGFGKCCSSSGFGVFYNSIFYGDEKTISISGRDTNTVYDHKIKLSKGL
jgi:hypothetical protein